MLIPTQFKALVPGQQIDDIVLNAGTGEGRGGEMAEIMDAQSIAGPLPPRRSIPGRRRAGAALTLQDIRGKS